MSKVNAKVMNEIRNVLQTPYNKILRSYLPRKISVLNAVPIRYVRLLDFDDHTPDWKDGTVSSVKEAVESGDSVVEVGGGFGVCTVWAARQAGTDGSVVSFEASENRVKIMQETLQLNDVTDRVSIRHTLVGENVDVFGELANATQVSPEDLPSCDVLITDCEGAELDLLRRLGEITSFNPRTLVVETHGFAGSSTDSVIEELRSQGYEIVNVQSASPHGSLEEDNKVVIAIVG